MQNKNIFYNTKIKCTVIDAILNYTSTTKDWKIRPVYTSFYDESKVTDTRVIHDKTLPVCTTIPFNILKGDPFLKAVKSFCDFSVFYYPPSFFYPLHIDSTPEYPGRKAGINVELQESDCITFFIEKGFFIEIPYEIGMYTLLNVNIPHAILNRTKERYVFTIEPLRAQYNYEYFLKKFNHE